MINLQVVRGFLSLKDLYNRPIWVVITKECDLETLLRYKMIKSIFSSVQLIDENALQQK